jgi:hypothetical protein
MLESASNTLTSYSNYFKKYFCNWERVKTLIAAGPSLMNKLCKQYKINYTSLNIYLLIQFIINVGITTLDKNNSNKKYLDLSNLIFEAKHFTSVIYAYYFENVVYIDLTNVKMDYDKTKILSNFLNKNASVENLIMEGTNLDYNLLYFIVTSIRLGHIKNFSVLNISNNIFSSEIPEEDISLDNPNQFLFCLELCKISSLKELIMINVQPQSDVLTIFHLMYQFKKNLQNQTQQDYKSVNIIKNDVSTSFDNHIKKINLSNVNFTTNLTIITKDYFAPICNYISLLTNFQEIYLPNCNINDEEVKLLMQSLIMVKNQINVMKVIDLSGNKITPRGAVFLKDFLLILNKKSSQKNVEEINTTNNILTKFK